MKVMDFETDGGASSFGASSADQTFERRSPCGDARNDNGDSVMAEARKPYSSPLTGDEMANVDSFCALYSQWLAARAVIAVGIDDDAVWNQRQDELDAVEMQLLFAPVRTEWAMWRKFEVLELAVNAVNRDGVSDPSRAARALAAIKMDLMHLHGG